MGDLTLLAGQAVRGDAQAQAVFLEAVHAELHRLAAREFRREFRSHTLQTTALMNEAFLRIFGSAPVAIESRQHFFNIAARTMRRVLVDHARSRAASKRPDPNSRVEIGDIQVSNAAGGDPETILAVHGALEKLQALDPRLAQVVELRFFGGLSVEETAVQLDISEKTVKRDFAAARAFLERELSGKSNLATP